MAFDLSKEVELELPALVASNFVALPATEIRTDVVDAKDVKAIRLASNYQNLVVILHKVQPNLTGEQVSNYYKIATVCQIVLQTAVTATHYRVKLKALARCEIDTITTYDPSIMVSCKTVNSYVKDEQEAKATLDLIHKEGVIEQSLTPQDKLNSTRLAGVFKTYKTLDDFTDAAVAELFDEKQKYPYLIELNINKRLLNILSDIRQTKSIEELENKIDARVQKNMTDAQKEYYLREKMRAIQEELGDKAIKDQDVENIRNKIKGSKMPESMMNKALTELNRYQMMPSNSPESGIIKTYLDFVLSLPWGITSKDNNDIVRAKEILDEDHYGLDKVKNRILEYLAVKIMTNNNPSTILCLVGPPGVGKTSLAKSIARALDKKFVKQSLGGVKDESEIRGHRRTYLGALPGRILQSLAKAKTNNPLFLLDEIDKMSSDYKGDPTSAMLEVLDAEQNKFFSDNYLEEPFDLSNCFFLCTANYLENIPAPLRDRLEIVEVSSYTEYEKFEIAKRHLLPKQMKLHGLDSSKFSLADDCIYHIIQNYTREAGVRELERLLGSIIRKSIKLILMDKLERVDVTLDNLEEFLGKEKFEFNKSSSKDHIGVVTGLAYTEFGGDTLDIEVAHYKGNGGIKLTGKLGDVMKESAETALSYVKAHAEQLGIDYDLFKTNDIHVHVPEGATPKDGPSAGVTMVTAIVSSFTSRPVDRYLGMTGEITLRGRVLPIGGLREKSIAAHRSGLKRILIPSENVKDIDEIPESVKEQLEIIPINNAMEAIKYALK